jgi:hypothetical protein
VPWAAAPVVAAGRNRRVLDEVGTGCGRRDSERHPDVVRIADGTVDVPYTIYPLLRIEEAWSSNHRTRAVAFRSDRGRPIMDAVKVYAMLGLKDRVEATGGTILVHSPRGEGTRPHRRNSALRRPADELSRLISIAPRLQLAGMRARRLRCQAEAVTFCLPDSQH